MKKRSKEQMPLLKNPYIDLIEITRITDTIKEYSRIYDFEKNVLQVATEEICRSTNFPKLVMRRSRKGVAVESNSTSIKTAVSVLPYKESDPAYQEGRRGKQHEQETLGNTCHAEPIYFYSLGMTDCSHDMQDIFLMGNLQNQVIKRVFNDKTGDIKR